MEKKFIYENNAKTKIYLEEPSEKTPFVSVKNHIHGYDISEIIQKISYSDAVFLLLKGELPNKSESYLFEKLLLINIHLGIRHQAIRASMIAGVSKANTEHIIPIGSTIAGGSINGGIEVEKSMDFIYKNQNKIFNIEEIAINNSEEEIHIFPGFGTSFGIIDILQEEYLLLILSNVDMNDYPTLRWTLDLVNKLKEKNYGLLKTGLVAALLCELKFKSRLGSCIFQYMAIPSIIAQGIEQSHNPITAMPLLKDDKVIYKGEKK